jgi:hypothetical protein
MEVRNLARARFSVIDLGGARDDGAEGSSGHSPSAATCRDLRSLQWARPRSTRDLRVVYALQAIAE